MSGRRQKLTGHQGHRAAPGLVVLEGRRGCAHDWESRAEADAVRGVCRRCGKEGQWPALPKGREWLAVTRERWVEFWASPVGPVALTVDGRTALTRLATYWDEWERCARGVGRKRLVAGSMGQVRLNPLATHMLALEALILRLEERFGITPQSRMRLGIDFGNAMDGLDALNEALNEDGDEDGGYDTSGFEMEEPTA